MSYYRIFNPPKETIDKIDEKAKKVKTYDYGDTKTEIKIYCLLDHTNESISNVINHLRYLLFSLNYNISLLSYKYAMERYKDDKNHELWFSGRDYANDEPSTTTEELNDDVINRLTAFCFIIKTPNWFDDADNYYKKEEEIDSIIEYFIEVSETNGDYEIINLVKQWEVQDDYNDKEIFLDENCENLESIKE